MTLTNVWFILSDKNRTNLISPRRTIKSFISYFFKYSISIHSFIYSSVCIFLSIYMIIYCFWRILGNNTRMGDFISYTLKFGTLQKHRWHAPIPRKPSIKKLLPPLSPKTNFPFMKLCETFFNQCLKFQLFKANRNCLFSK